MIGFVAYLIAYLGLQIGQGNVTLVAALMLTVSLLFLVSWMFISQTHADWVKTTRFIALGLIFEGFVLYMARSTGREASLYFGIGAAVIGLLLLVFAKRH